jgi:hypothetical protein
MTQTEEKIRSPDVVNIFDVKSCTSESSMNQLDQINHD